MRDDTVRVRVRGIYSTALTKFFLDNGYEITQPSSAICERFGVLEPNYLSPHIDIQTQGSRAVIESLQRYTNDIRSLLLENFEDIIIQQHPMIKSSIWKGIVVKRQKDGYIVRFSVNMDGFLPTEETLHQYQEGDLVVVEVKNFDTQNNRIILTDTISVPGEFIVLIKKETIKVSRKIRGAKKIELMDLGNILRPPGWGAIFRTSAMYASPEEISEEMNKLKDYTDRLMATADKAPAFTQIREGINILYAYFPLQSKRVMDSIRSKIAPTIHDHHWIKATGKMASYLVDFVEKYLSEIPHLNLEELSEMVKTHVRRSILPKEGDIIKILHLKPSLRRVILGPAKVIDVRESDQGLEYILFRKFKSGGYYDGINAPKEVGDYGITIAREGDTKLVTAYFDMNSELKGIYVNINTPIEIYTKSIRYVDLEIDVVRTFEGEITILDRQKLEKYVEQCTISKALYEKAQRLSEKYKAWLETHGVDEVLDTCSEIRELISLEIEP